MTGAVLRRDDPGAPQADASDPSVSAWVTANAGSGKTKVLIDRVARLLLGRAQDRGQEPDPSKILCLTYTRAAAAHMQNQLFRRLGGWALLDDVALTAQIQALAPNRADAVDLPRARRLFAQALETPGGLKIQTIHAFCESLLRRFPIEARVSPHFALLDEVETAALLREASERAIRRALEGGNSALRDAAMRVMDRVQESGLPGMVKAVIGRRALFAPPFEDIEAGIDDALGVDPGARDADAVAAFVAALPQDDIRSLIRAFTEHGGKHEAESAGVLAEALEEDDPWTMVPALRGVFLTAKGEKRATRGFPTKAVVATYPEAGAVIADLQERLLSLEEHLRAIETAANSRALARFAKALLVEIRALKAQKDALDFDDLIEKAGALLTRAEARDWVRYKLDGGVDHILVDEAQDTSAAQWAVIGAIAEEFFAGEGAREVHRTLFVVGDEKQSIYSFQGAAPQELARMRARFANLTREAAEPMREPALLHSFRSTPAVLDAVDRVFAQDAARDGLSADGEAPVHLAWREDRPGRVEFWPPVTPGEKAERKPWWQPVDMPVPDAPHLRLAEAVAERIGDWLGSGAELPARGRPIQAGDILILVRRRAAFAEAMIRALKSRGLPVAGEDRMRLSDELAVKDLLAVARFALLPDDDLTLATVLRSPVIGVSEEALFDLAYGREGRLWPALSRRRNEAAFAEPYAILADLLDKADFLRPFEFFERVLREHGARARLLGRLGVQAEDPIDEFLSQALAFETAAIPTLQGFVERIETARFEVKREMEQGRDEIRIMTAHGAKGLEANIVFLPDTVGLPPADRLGLFALPAGGGCVPLWSPSKPGDAPAVVACRAAEREAELHELRRLLYVGMTRARDWLILCGHHGRRAPPPESWLRLVEGAFEGAGPCETPLRDAEGNPVQGLMIDNAGTRIDREGPVAADRSDAAAPPEALLSPVRPEAVAAVPLSPSRLMEADPGDPPPLPVADETAVEPVSSAERGTRMHALLARLAPLPPEHRRAAAPLEAGDEDGALDTVLRILEDPTFAWMFGPETMAEVPFAGPVPVLGGRSVSGIIDRLVVGPDAVDIVDFKSGAAPAAAPEAYLRQMAVYTAAIGAVFPRRTVRAHLLWLDAARLDTLPQEALSAALARVVDSVGPHP